MTLLTTSIDSMIPGYDPAYNFDLLYKTLVHDVNCVSKVTETDQCGDKTTYLHGGHGEKGSGLVGRVFRKPGVSKGGQIVMISETHRAARAG